MGENKPKPDAEGVAYGRQKEAMKLCRDVYEGTLQLRKQTTEYLPQFPKEPDDDYARRVRTSVLFNAFAHTIDGLTGMVMREDPELGDDVDAVVSGKKGGAGDEAKGAMEGAHWEDIDLEGTHGAIFAGETLRDALIDGHSFIFVDMQTVDGEVRSLAEERQMGLRPYWVHIRKDQVIRWRSEHVAGQRVLTEVAWKECTVERKNEWEEEEVERVRIYRLRMIETKGEGAAFGVTYDLWVKRDGNWVQDGGERTLLAPGGRPYPRIPLSVVYAGRRKGFLESSPALEDVAHENVAHYQLRSDRMHTLHLCGMPVPYFVNRTPKRPGEEVTVGPGWGIDLEEGGEAGYLEPMGNGLEESRNEQQDIEKRMAALGLSMLMPEFRSAETARGHELERSEKDSKLDRAARSLMDALENSLKYHAMWMGGEDGGSVEVNRDYKSLQLDPQVINQLREMVGSGQLSLETMWERLVAGEILDKSFDPELERERIKKDDELAPAPPPMPFPPVPPTDPNTDPDADPNQPPAPGGGE